MASRETAALSGRYLNVYHAASAYIDMDYRKPLALRNAVREAIHADLLEKQSSGIPMTLHTKAHRAYTDKIMQDMERDYPMPETTGMGRFAYWSMTVTTCLGLYLLARLFFLDLDGETPYAVAVTWQRLLTFLGLLLTLELVSMVIRKQAGGKRRILTGGLLLVAVAVMFPAFPLLPRFPAGTGLFRLNLLLPFILSLAAAMVSRKLEREKHSPDGR